jgi:hypothetical protein
MTIQELSQALDLSSETLEKWIRELEVPVQYTESQQILNAEIWLPYFKQAKALFSAGRKPSEIRQAVPLPEGVSRPAPVAVSAQGVQDVAHQLEMRIASLQFHLKNTQGEMIKEQKSIAKLQKQTEDLQRTVEVLQRTLSSTNSQNEKMSLFLSRFWIYQALTSLATLALVIILGRFIFTSAKPSPVPMNFPSARQGVLLDAGAGESSPEPAPVETPVASPSASAVSDSPAPVATVSPTVP